MSGPGRVVALHAKRRRHAPLDPMSAAVVTERGIEGDVHAGDGRGRQLLLTHAGDLRDLGLRPGDLREQVTVELPGLMALQPGTRLRLGGATVETTGPCEPCTHIGEHVGVDDRDGFRDRLRGRRGMLASVVEGGIIHVGDAVVQATTAAQA